MSSLCKYSFITINKNDSSPTPTLRKTLNPCNDLLPVKFLQTANFIKRISLLILLSRFAQNVTELRAKRN